MEASHPGYEALERPEILSRIFHPRPEIPGGGPGEDLTIPVDDGCALGARFHPAGHGAATLLFFHGNGEIARDYDDLGPHFAATGVNFLVVDYRGYGRSTGAPGLAAMLRDARATFDFVCQWLARRGSPDRVLVAGRSLGSASALEVAAAFGTRVRGLVVESGFAQVAPLLRTLGLDPDRLGLAGDFDLHNLDKIAAYPGPTLVVHGEHDALLPPENARLLYAASGSQRKRLLLLPDADHNSVFLYGLDAYLAGIRELAAAAADPPRSDAIR